MNNTENENVAPIDFKRGLRGLAIGGVASIALFAGTVGVWAVATTLSGAVVASGQFVVDGNVKKVQHQSGGIVGELLVKEGDRVERDAVVIRLDDTLTRANLQVVSKQLDEFSVRRARLLAERDRKDQVAMPAELVDRAQDEAIVEMMDSERTLFLARRTAREGQKSQLSKRMGQLRDEILGLNAQQTGRDRQAKLIEEELVGVRDLYTKNLVALTRKNSLEREAASLLAQKGQLLATVAQTEGKIAEIELQMIHIDDVLREEVMKELRDIQGKWAEYAERRTAATDMLKRVEIRSPSAGYVHQLAVHTVGGVISPAEPAMLIVPEDDGLQVEARVQPSDIDQIVVGREARVRIHAFNQRTTPELMGKVSRMSADITRDQQTGATYYTIRVAIDKGEVERLDHNKVTAGMQAEVYVTTESRTPLEFLMKPIQDQVAKAFRER